MSGILNPCPSADCRAPLLEQDPERPAGCINPVDAMIGSCCWCPPSETPSLAERGISGIPTDLTAIVLQQTTKAAGQSLESLMPPDGVAAFFRRNELFGGICVALVLLMLKQGTLPMPIERDLPQEVKENISSLMMMIEAITIRTCCEHEIFPEFLTPSHPLALQIIQKVNTVLTQDYGISIAKIDGHPLSSLTGLVCRPFEDLSADSLFPSGAEQYLILFTHKESFLTTHAIYVDPIRRILMEGQTGATIEIPEGIDPKKFILNYIDGYRSTFTNVSFMELNTPDREKTLSPTFFSEWNEQLTGSKEMISTLYGSKTAVKPLLAKRPYKFQDLSEELRNDPALALIALANETYPILIKVIFESAGPAVKNDPRCALIALTKYGDLLEHAGDDVKKDKECVLAALRSNQLSINHLHPSLWKNRDICREALLIDFYIIEGSLIGTVEIGTVEIFQDILGDEEYLAKAELDWGPLARELVAAHLALLTSVTPD